MPLAKLRNENAAAKSTLRKRVSIKTYWMPQQAAESNAYPHQVMGILLSGFCAPMPVGRSRHREQETKYQLPLLILEAGFGQSCRAECLPPGTIYFHSDPSENRLGYSPGASMPDEHEGQVPASLWSLRGKCRPEKFLQLRLADTCFRNRRYLTTSEQFRPLPTRAHREFRP